MQDQPVDLQPIAAQGTQHLAQRRPAGGIVDARQRKAPEVNPGQGLQVGGFTPDGNVGHADQPVVNRQPPEVEAQRQRTAHIIGHHRHSAAQALELAAQLSVRHVPAHELAQPVGQRVVFGPWGQIDDGSHPGRGYPHSARRVKDLPRGTSRVLLWGMTRRFKRSPLAVALATCLVSGAQQVGAQQAPRAEPPPDATADAGTAPSAEPTQPAAPEPTAPPQPGEPKAAPLGAPPAQTSPAAPPAPATSPAPAPSTAAPPAAQPAPDSAPPAPSAQPAATTAPAAEPIDPETALVHLSANYEGAWLELRNYVDDGDWERACQAPCDRRLRVVGMEARITAPGMTDSNVFRLESGHGRVLLKASGGSSALRTAGLVGLISGIPVAMTGMGLFGYGGLQDDDGFRTAGAIVLGVGAVTVLASLPMLAFGSTTVRTGQGDMIAARPAGWVF